jgi:hypothetical protein
MPQYENYRTPENQQAFHEAYEVVKTVVVVKGEQTFRLEVWKTELGANVPFAVRCWLQKPDHPYGPMWIKHNLPAISGRDVETALTEAVQFLAR